MLLFTSDDLEMPIDHAVSGDEREAAPMSIAVRCRLAAA
jgi:hypothetical protein